MQTRGPQQQISDTMGAILSAAKPRSPWDLLPPSMIIGTMAFPESVCNGISLILPSRELRRTLKLIPREGELEALQDAEEAPKETPIAPKSLHKKTSALHPGK